MSKKYDSYKDSGIEWIGEIPSHWDFFNLKFILREGVKDGPHETPIWFEEGIPFLSIDGIINGEISFEKCRFIDEEQFEKFSKKLIIEKDDIFIGKAASIGKIARVKTDRKFTVWSPIAVVKVKKEYNPVFVEYYFRSDIVQHQIELLSTTNTQKNIAMGDIPKMKFIAPSEEEQTTIANYLDHKTTEIDTLITKKERLIQLLEEERTAIINQTVTKGLDPNVPMKDSGIEWLGEIPEHWNYSSLKWYSKIYSGGTPSKDIEEFWKNGTIPWLNSGCVNQWDITEVSDYITEDAFNNSSAKWIPSKSLVIALAGQGKTKGMVAQVQFDTTCNQSLGVIVPNEKINNRFLQYWLKNNYYNIRSLGGGDKRDGLNLVMIGGIPIPIPPFEEQVSIAHFLDCKNIELDSLNQVFLKEIELLKEFKTALISEVVTGKVDVRNEKLN